MTWLLCSSLDTLCVCWFTQHSLCARLPQGDMSVSDAEVLGLSASQSMQMTLTSRYDTIGRALWTANHVMGSRPIQRVAVSSILPHQFLPLHTHTHTHTHEDSVHPTNTAAHETPETPPPPAPTRTATRPAQKRANPRKRPSEHAPASSTS